MILKLVLDRYEENIGVCLDENDKKYEISKDILSSIEENDIFTIEFDGENYHSPKKLEHETAEKKESISKRMNRLFKMSRDRRPPKI